METERRVYGVDFSGGKHAGRKIWLARGSVNDGALRIEECFRGEDLPGAGRLLGQCLPALRYFITQQRDAIFGFDFPFGVCRKFVPNCRWEDYILSFPKVFDSPQQFRTYCYGRAQGSGTKRQTDILNRAPFSPCNLRLFRQTYYGIRDVLHPLLHDELACALPMQKPVLDKPWLLEVCPACTLKKLDLYQRYKGKTDEHRQGRERILAGIESMGLMVARSLRLPILEDPEGDALDSVIAAFIVFRSMGALSIPCDDVCQSEGYIYV